MNDPIGILPRFKRAIAQVGYIDHFLFLASGDCKNFHHRMPSESLPNGVASAGTRVLLRQRIWPKLKMDGHRFHSFPALLKPRYPIAARRPQSAPLPTGIRIIYTPVEPFRIKTKWIGDA